MLDNFPHPHESLDTFGSLEASDAITNPLHFCGVSHPDNRKQGATRMTLQLLFALESDGPFWRGPPSHMTQPDSVCLPSL